MSGVGVVLSDQFFDTAEMMNWIVRNRGPPRGTRNFFEEKQESGECASASLNKILAFPRQFRIIPLTNNERS